MDEFIIPDWPAPHGIRAYQTTRQGGVSTAPFTSFNLGTHVDDDPKRVRENRRVLSERLGLPNEPIWLKQVHGTQVVEGSSYDGEGDADASVSFEPEVVLAVMTADCLPVLFCDKAGTIVAAAHAGWRGLAAGVLEETVAAMRVDPREILAWFGPAIGPESFEVGGEVREAFLRDDRGCGHLFRPSPGQRWLADLYGLAARRLEGLGVTHPYGGSHCTFRDGERFFSYRRDGQTGRMVSLIWLEPL